MGQEIIASSYISLNEHLKTTLGLTLQQQKVYLLCEGNTHLKISIRLHWGVPRVQCELKP